MDGMEIVLANQALIQQFARATTRPGARYTDLVRWKTRTVEELLAHAGRRFEDVRPADVARWVEQLHARGLAHSTVYAKCSAVSSFYTWLRRQGVRVQNPVLGARPRAPRAYQSERTQALDDDEVRALLQHVRELAKTDISAKRDYALLVLYFATGKRRAEIIHLRAGDVKRNGVLKIRTREKGGQLRVTEVQNPSALEALEDYLHATGRSLATMAGDEPLWLRHDRAATRTQALSSHGFVKNLKRYARDVGLGDIHLHQTRHTVARKVAQAYKDLGVAQSQLGHADRRTTQVYVGRLLEQADYVTPVAGDWFET
jgi:integrase/recombinase XerC